MIGILYLLHYNLHSIQYKYIHSYYITTLSICIGIMLLIVCKCLRLILFLIPTVRDRWKQHSCLKVIRQRHSLNLCQQGNQTGEPKHLTSRDFAEILIWLHMRVYIIYTIRNIVSLKKSVDSFQTSKESYSSIVQCKILTN